MRIHVPSTSCNGQTQLCPLQVTCAEWRDLSDHTRMSRFQSRTPQKMAKKPCNIDLKISMKILFHCRHYYVLSFPLILISKELFQKPFPPNWSLLNPQPKKNEARKANKGGGEKVKSKSHGCCVIFKPKNYFKILLSAHARTSQADILHLDQKATRCATCKRLCAKF